MAEREFAIQLRKTRLAPTDHVNHRCPFDFVEPIHNGKRRAEESPSELGWAKLALYCGTPVSPKLVGLGMSAQPITWTSPNRPDTTMPVRMAPAHRPNRIG